MVVATGYPSHRKEDQMYRQEPGGLSLLLLGLAILGPSIWLDSSLTGGDEYNITFPTVLETVESDDWTVPTLNDEPRLRKPPLYYWLLASSVHWFGSGPLALRFWGVLAGTLLAIFTAKLGQKCCGANPTLTFLIVISTIGLATESRRAMLDVPMAFLIVCSMERLACWKSEGGAGKAAISGLLLGMATLIKPVALLFGVTGAISLFLVGPQRSPSARPGQLTAFLFLMLLVTVPWWLVVADRFPELLQQRWQEQIARREISWLHLESIPSLLGGLLGLVLPWSIIAISALYSFLKRKAEGLETPERWLAVWVILSTIPFFFTKTFERYLIPVLPILAILISSHLEAMNPAARKKHLMVSTVLLGIPCLLIAAFVGWFSCSLIAAIAIPCIWLLMWAGSTAGAPKTCALSAAGMLAVVMGIALPSIGIGSLPQFPKRCQDTPIAIIGSPMLPTLSLREGQPLATLPTDPRQLSGAFPSEKTTLLVKDHHLPELESALTLAAREASRVASYKIFQSRKTFVRFTRPDLTVEEWKLAIEDRSLDSLRIPCSIFVLEPLP